LTQTLTFSSADNTNKMSVENLEDEHTQRFEKMATSAARMDCNQPIKFETNKLAPSYFNDVQSS